MTAKEARQITDNNFDSQAELEFVFENIRKAALKAKNRTFLSLSNRELHGLSKYQKVSNENVEKLKQLGYKITEEYQAYVEPMGDHKTLFISW